MSRVQALWAGQGFRVYHDGNSVLFLDPLDDSGGVLFLGV